MLSWPHPGSDGVYRSHKHSLQGFQLGFELKSSISDLVMGLERTAHSKGSSHGKENSSSSSMDSGCSSWKEWPEGHPQGCAETP